MTLHSGLVAFMATAEGRYSLRKLVIGCPAVPPENVLFCQVPVARQLVRFCSTVF
jgi:hypothetical protein